MAGSGTAFLTTRLGPEATTNDELARVSFLFPLVRTNVVLFTNLTLEAGTYYLTLAGNEDAWESSWAEGCAADFTSADGVMLGEGYRLERLDPYVPASQARGNFGGFFHFSVIAGTNGLPVERPVAPPEINRRPVVRDQFFRIQENGSQTFRFDAVDPDGDPLAIDIGPPPANGTLTTERLWAGPYTGWCFPTVEVTYTALGGFLGEEVIELWAGDHTGFTDEPDQSSSAVSGDFACRGNSGDPLARNVMVGGVCSLNRHGPI
jgi:hypothetical protein